jgi:membrane associated rhomboid family serine protease
MDEPRSDASAGEAGPSGGRDAELDVARAARGPLAAPIALGLLKRGRERLDASEPQAALADFQRVVGQADATLTAAAWLGVGDALYRLDAEPQALAAWEAVVKLPETRSTYDAWRRIAGARVRANELAQAREAYREADRRAPAEDKAEIASRLGWLSKELGQTRAAGRYFARSRGGVLIGATLTIIAITVLVSLAAFFQAPGNVWIRNVPPHGSLYALLELNPTLVLQGQLYRLFTVTLLHSEDPTFFWLHLFFNMYALYLVGPVAEQIWGRRWFVAFYLLTAAAASTASVVFSGVPAVGASGAIFGILGVLLAGTRVHRPVLDVRSRALVGQLGFWVLLNLGIGFAFGGGLIDNSAHIGGLVSGMWLGLVVPPTVAKTLRSSWQLPAGSRPGTSPILIAAGVLLLIAVVALGLAFAGATL